MVVGCCWILGELSRVMSESGGGRVFTTLHWMQMWSSDEISVCLSVCPSVRQTRGLWERKISPDYYTVQKIFHSSFVRKRMVGGGRPLLTEILGQPAPIGAKSPILNQESLVAPQLYDLVKKSSSNTNRKSPTRFQTSLRWSSYVAPKSPKGGSKTQNGRFPLKSHFAWKKSAAKFLYVKTVSSRVVGHSWA